MRDSPLQFGVVREDPAPEAELLAASRGPKRALLVASGGCTALSLQALHPDASFVLVDPNPAQLAHVRRKIDALGLPGAERKAALGIGGSGPSDLNQRGNFESLFRGLRSLLHDLVAPPDEWHRLFAAPLPERAALLAHVTEARFWPVAFRLFFSDDMLHAIFGRAATQHAQPDSYPDYFRRAFERGLARPDAPRNWFLHHVLLGHYLDDPEALPPYLAVPAPPAHFEYVEAPLETAADRVRGCGLVHLSNVFDWMDDSAIAVTGKALAANAAAGTCFLLRQLNNERDLRRHLPGVRWDDARGEALTERDRSLFYQRVHVGVRE